MLKPYSSQKQQKQNKWRIPIPTDDDTGEKSVSVLLSGEESELVFIDHTHTDVMVSNY